MQGVVVGVDAVDQDAPQPPPIRERLGFVELYGPVLARLRQHQHGPLVDEDEGVGEVVGPLQRLGGRPDLAVLAQHDPTDVRATHAVVEVLEEHGRGPVMTQHEGIGVEMARGVRKDFERGRIQVQIQG